MKRFTILRLAVSIFTIAFLSATIVFFISSSRNLFFKHSVFSLKHVAQEKSSTIDAELRYAEGSIQLLSNFVSSQMKERELKNPNEILSKYERTLPFDIVEYIRWDGLNFMNSIAGSEPFDASERPYYKEGIKGNSGIWPNFRPKVAKEVLLNFYTPLYYNGEISGVLTGAIGETTTLKSKLTSSFFGHQIASFVCNEDYVVVSSVCETIEPGLDLKEWVSSKMIYDIIEHSKNNDLDPFKYEYTGRTGLCCIAPIKFNGWHVVVIAYPSVLKEIENENSGNLFRISILIIFILFIYLSVSLGLQAKSNKIINKGLIEFATRDELTGLLNRHAYEDDLKNLENMPIPEDFYYVVFDVNGLKATNDNLGHVAGDELIKAAAKCIQDCYGKYGKVYRTGGDEFIAIINTSEETMQTIIENFSKQTSEWKGHFSENLRIPAGYVSGRENPDTPLHEITKLADQRMYKEKSIIYIASGEDRRAESVAYEVLCNSYTKILKVNLTTDDFHIIQMDSSERDANKGYSDKISSWLHDFGASGQVHKDDVLNYLSKTSLSYMRDYFKAGNKELNVLYRRKIGNEFCKVLMEMKPAKDYTNENQSIFLYVKNIDKS